MADLVYRTPPAGGVSHDKIILAAYRFQNIYLKYTLIVVSVAHSVENVIFGHSI